MLYVRLSKLIKKHFQNHFTLYFILFCAFVLGNIFGAVFLKRLSYGTKIFIFKGFHPFLKSVNEYTKFLIFKNLFLFNALVLLITFLVGLFNLGYIFIPIIITSIGGTIGFRVSFLVSYFKLKGFWLSILGIYPQYLFYIVGFLGIGSLSMSLSDNVFKNNHTRITSKIFTNKEYYILYCFFIVFSFLGIITEVICSPILKLILNDIIL